jgi:hypothetical protein
VPRNSLHPLNTRSCRRASAHRRRAGVLARRCAAVSALALLCALASAAPAGAQTEVPRDARVLWESLALVPTLRVPMIGWDDNVFYQPDANNPQGDFTTTVSPALQAWLRVPGVLVTGRTRVDFVYFRDLSQIRSVDTDNSARLELLFGRLVPFVDGARANTRHREYDLLAFERSASGATDVDDSGLEIDAPVRRVDTSWGAGVQLRLTGKTSIDLVTRRGRVDYQGDEFYLGTELARQLDGYGTSNAVGVRYAVTPFTTIGAEVSQYRTSFDVATERDSEGVQVASLVEFNPLAAVTGRARVGLRTRDFLDGDAPRFEGIVADAGLAYTLLGRTRFAVGIRRDISASYRLDQRDYLETALELSVTHRVANAWDVRGTVGRFNLSYGLGAVAPGGQAATEEERIARYGFDIGHNFGSARLGFQVGRQTKSSPSSPGRQYERTRIGSSIAYRF